MTSVILDDVAALQTINGAIVANSKTVYAPVDMDTYPMTPDTALLPLCLVWPDQGTWSGISFDNSKREQIRDYRMQFLLLPVGQGQSIPKVRKMLVNLMQAVIDAYSAYNNVALTANTYQYLEGALADTGIYGVIEWGTIPYHGFEVTAKVHSVWDV